MLFKLLIPFTLTAVIGVRATPVFDFPDVILRAKIPVGITVHEYNATAAAVGAAATPKVESRGLLKERNDCHGSGECKFFVSGNDCISAANQYVDDNYYCSYTSRFFNNCTAMYRNFDGIYEHCLSGNYLKEMFANIYSVQGCGRCGTYDIPNRFVNNGHVTYNYCYHCANVG